MHFGEVDIKKGCANFARLWGQTPFFILLGKEYARSRGMDEEECAFGSALQKEILEQISSQTSGLVSVGYLMAKGG